MTESKLPEGQQILAILRRLEGVQFAGQAFPIVQTPGVSSCTCQNCSCNARIDDFCGCHPNCVCQGKTALDRPEDWMNALLGVAAALPLEDIRTLVGMRDKLQEALEKPSK